MKKRCRKVIGLLTAALLITGCGKQQGQNAFVLQPGQSDLKYVQSKDTFVIGITDFAPMDYQEGEEWVGFDAALAEKFAEGLGVTPEFKEIDWDQKTKLLENGTVDCIWNGMTMTEELQNTITCSEPYLSNAQVAVLREEDCRKYESIEECQHLLFAVESGSTGEDLLKELRYRYTAYPTQKDALQSVCDKETDAAVIDIIMAAYYTGEDQEFGGLGFQFSLNDEKICVGLRKDSDLAERVNTFLADSGEDGTLKELAEKYGIEGAVLDRQ